MTFVAVIPDLIRDPERQAPGARLALGSAKSREKFNSILLLRRRDSAVSKERRQARAYSEVTLRDASLLRVRVH